MSLNPRFDGAFLIPTIAPQKTASSRLNPRFDGAFLILKLGAKARCSSSLNPRFDGAFLIRQTTLIMRAGLRS